MRNRIRNHKLNLNKARAGFSLVELMITMSIFFVILFVVYNMITEYAGTTRTEQARIKMQQESRYIMSSFTQDIKEAGAVLTLANAWGDYAPSPASFTGIYPLNNTNYADGIIIATGDPYVVGYLDDAYNAGDAVMTLESVIPTGYDPILAAAAPDVYATWTAGDKGIVVDDKGYYVFQVTRVNDTANTLELRATPIYYSGLLFTNASLDGTKIYQDAMGYKGNSLTYRKGMPVIKLINFSIYLLKEVPHPVEKRNIRQLVRVTDTQGDQDVLGDTSLATVSVISENIYDMQISYVGYQDFAGANRNTAYDEAFSFFGSISGSQNLSDCVDRINRRYLKQINISIVSITDQMGGGKFFLDNATVVHKVPPIGDQAAYNLPRGKYMFKILTISLEPRNYNIALKPLPL